jgi:peptidoglycan/xylan/chitin deacetylase (PgdA/CDA1 family)
MMRLRTLARRAFAVTPLPEAVLRRRAKRFLTVLGYHRIMPPASADYAFNEGVISATPEEFARELRFLRANLDVLSIPQLVEGLRNPALMPQRPAVITFDDGYVDNHTHAFPLLKEAGLPACFFVCTALVGTRSIPWTEAWVCCLKQSRVDRIDSPFGTDDPPYLLDPEHRAASIRRFRERMRQVPWSLVPATLERLREATSVRPEEHLAEPLFMSWDAAREMAAAGMTFGGHTRTHPVLSCVDDPSTLRDEIGGCYEDLEAELGEPPQAFAYPFGAPAQMSERADAEIKRAGFQVLFSFVHGFAPRHTEGLCRLPRIHASLVDDYDGFRVRMATAPGANGQASRA